MDEGAAPQNPLAEPGEDLEWVADRDTPPRRDLRTARFGWPSMIALLVFIGGAGLGAASIGGWAGFALIVVLVVLLLGLLYLWSSLTPDPEV